MLLLCGDNVKSAAKSEPVVGIYQTLQVNSIYAWDRTTKNFNSRQAEPSHVVSHVSKMALLFQLQALLLHHFSTVT